MYVQSFVFDNEIFNYTQTVNAVYLSTNINLPNDFSLKAGTRYEHTNIEGNWKNNSDTTFSENYENILPNLTFSKKLSMGKSFKLSYSSRISRPSSSYINTNTNITNNKNITVGNPELSPTTTKQISS